MSKLLGGFVFVCLSFAILHGCGSGDDGCEGTCQDNCPVGYFCNTNTCVCELDTNICTTHDDCDANSICIYDNCETAYGRMFRLTLVSAVVSDYDQNGEAWDWPGGMPDPMVCFYENFTGTPTGPTGAKFCTSIKQDIFSPTFNESFETALFGSDKWLIIAFDEDVTDYELIEGARAEPIQVDWIKAGGFRYQGDYLLDLLVGVEPVL